ncbi:hypothetical protein OMO38_04765 [Chryseobacterium sp. 09-1422]|uniref:Lipoprotein n=1 Tax=Chryseobacterium kimseyorum TaxID=2984028 RepID=A0ABT3HVM3_9FLAO|nr:hypothetical protein [Chryseobacterium kimseyorum]MCW3167836.1 hypothetical protein [Chryseobacterium kimseyorum]
MKRFFLILTILFIGCKEEKTFADDIVLSFPKGENLTFQQFNEGIGENGTGIIYIGKDTSKINVQYFQSIIPAPPPPPGYEFGSVDIGKQKMMSSCFHDASNRIKDSEKPVRFDSLSEKNVKIVAKIKDTIPKYAFNYDTQTLKKYKAFPIFIKNISGQKLILTEFKNLPLTVLNEKNKWQTIWNDNAFVCGNSRWQYRYWEFNPDEIMVLSVNYLTGKNRAKFKIWTGNSSSDEFTMNYDKQIVKNQRNYFEVK